MTPPPPHAAGVFFDPDGWDLLTVAHPCPYKGVAVDQIGPPLPVARYPMIKLLGVITAGYGATLTAAGLFGLLAVCPAMPDSCPKGRALIGDGAAAGAIGCAIALVGRRVDS